SQQLAQLMGLLDEFTEDARPQWFEDFKLVAEVLDLLPPLVKLRRRGIDADFRKHLACLSVHASQATTERPPAVRNVGPGGESIPGIARCLRDHFERAFLFQGTT